MFSIGTVDKIAYSRHPAVLCEVLASIGVGHGVADANEVGRHRGACYEFEILL